MLCSFISVSIVKFYFCVKMEFGDLRQRLRHRVKFTGKMHSIKPVRDVFATHVGKIVVKNGNLFSPNNEQKKKHEKVWLFPCRRIPFEFCCCALALAVNELWMQQGKKWIERREEKLILRTFFVRFAMHKTRKCVRVKLRRCFFLRSHLCAMRT